MKELVKDQFAQDSGFPKVLYDKHIRELLKARLSKRHGYELPLVEEMKISQGRAYPDLVAFFRHPHCYEIKSSVDTLRRLDSQMSYYRSYFSKITIVSAQNHADRVLELTPEWVGVTLIRDQNTLVTLRKCGTNPDYEPLALLDLLWKDELLQLNQEVLGKFSKKSLSKKELIHQLLFSRNKSVVREEAIKKIVNRMQVLDRLSSH